MNRNVVSVGIGTITVHIAIVSVTCHARISAQQMCCLCCQARSNSRYVSVTFKGVKGIVTSLSSKGYSHYKIVCHYGIYSVHCT